MVLTPSRSWMQPAALARNRLDWRNLGIVSRLPISLREQLERAQNEALRRDLVIDFRVADMRQLWQAHQRTFDVVIACDNAIPHLLSNAEILTALEQFYCCAAPGGGCIISVRDYALMERSGRQFYPRLIQDTSQGRAVLFDVWEFDGDYYDLTIYVVEDNGQAEGKNTCCSWRPLLLRNYRDFGKVIPASRIL